MTQNLRFQEELKWIKSFWEILKFASDMTTASTGKIYVLFDKGGKIYHKTLKT